MFKRSEMAPSQRNKKERKTEHTQKPLTSIFIHFTWENWLMWNIANRSSQWLKAVAHSKYTKNICKIDNKNSRGSSNKNTNDNDNDNEGDGLDDSDKNNDDDDSSNSKQ